jgi:hypothetical protein
MHLINPMMTAVCGTAACILIKVSKSFRDKEMLTASITTLMMETVSPSETPVNFNETAWRNNPEHCHLHTRRCENIKTHSSKISTYVVLFASV